MAALETITYEAVDGVAWVTLNRPEVHNAFNVTMQHELRTVWRWLRRDDSIRCVVLTGAGEKAFSSGVDRDEVLGEGKETNVALAVDPGSVPDPAMAEPIHVASGSSPFMFDDPADYIGPKSNDLWKPVVAAVNGMACGGAFYMLGETDIIIAADHATFFDPHVTFGMPAGYEPLQLLPKMPFGEIVRMIAAGELRADVGRPGPPDRTGLRGVPVGRAPGAGRLGGRRDRQGTDPGHPGDAAGAVGGARALPPPGSRPGLGVRQPRHRPVEPRRGPGHLRHRHAGEAAIR